MSHEHLNSEFFGKIQLSHFLDATVDETSTKLEQASFDRSEDV
jgi:hypothetical protein